MTSRTASVTGLVVRRGTASWVLRSILATASLVGCLLAAAEAAIVWSGDVSPADPTLSTSTTTVSIGRGTVGSIRVDGGSSLSSSLLFLGQDASGIGTATIAGAGSTWTTSSLSVGSAGTGVLNIDAGGLMTSASGSMGSYPGSMATVRITGAGSRWINNGVLRVGDEGSGTLTVTDGGMACTQTLYASLGDLDGNGTIATNGAVLDADIVFSAAHGPQSVLTFGGGGALHLNPNYYSAMGAGYKATGTLAVAEGIVISSSLGYLGYHAGSSGAATVSGTGSTWRTRSDLYVGHMGSGSLTVADGGMVTTRMLHAALGDLSGDGVIAATGVLLDADLVFDATHGARQAVPFGEGGTLKLTVNRNSELGVGHKATGTLTITDGVTVASSSGMLGGGPGSHGSATVTDGSQWDNGYRMTVGGEGSGALSVAAGGRISTPYLYLGDSAGSTGSLTVSGTGSVAASTTYVGYGGDGSLSIVAGGRMSSADGGLGSYAGASGSATVSGAGSTWVNTGALAVGGLGSGTLTVTDGGVVTTQTLRASLSDLFGNGSIATHGAVLDTDLVFDSTRGSQQTLAFGEGGLLHLNIDSGNVLGVGHRGTGTLTIADGVTIHSSIGSLGDFVGAVGSATVSGSGSTWNNTAELFVGIEGAGALRVEAGARVSNAVGYVGYQAGSAGAVTVTGTGSTWNTSGAVFVGESGSGTLTIGAGGEVRSAHGYVAGRNIASSSTTQSGAGVVTVTGSGSNWTTTGDRAPRPS